MSRKQGFILGAKITGALLTAAALAALAGKKTNRWGLSGGWEFIAILVPVLVAWVSTVGSAWGQLRLERQRRLQADVRRRIDLTLAALLFRIQNYAPTVRGRPALDVRDMGATAYIIERSGWFRRREHLRMVSTVQWRSVAVCDITWRPGVGVVGLAASVGKPQISDVQAINERLGQATPEQWQQAMDEEERQGDREKKSTLGFSYDEWDRQVKGKFKAVAAAPLIGESGKVLGALSVDVMAPGPKNVDSFKYLSQHTVRLMLCAAAMEVTGDLT
jgi:hypothetical protein